MAGTHCAAGSAKILDAAVIELPDIDKWRDALGGGNTESDDVPAGWYTIRELAEQTNRSRATTSSKVSQMVKAGQAERRTYQILVGNPPKRYPVPHFRIKG